ncbi:MAG TPA: hypothetical protein VNA88_17760 [Candidatus Kapabacteria bacterium]|jgi:hypothetical protein|nr:hypothetical protein [Candidatus Kapabacteria bacterium]
MNNGQRRRYVFRIREKLDPHWGSRFSGLEMRHEDGGTVFAGELADAQALHGVLTAFNNLGLCLISVCEDLG